MTFKKEVCVRLARLESKMDEFIALRREAAETPHPSQRELLENVAQIIEMLRAKPLAKGEGVVRARPKKRRRGPKNTLFMDYQRRAVTAYVVEERKRPLASLTHADCHHVWHLQRHWATWEKRAKLKSDKRGYSNPKAIFQALKRMSAN